MLYKGMKIIRLTGLKGLKGLVGLVGLVLCALASFAKSSVLPLLRPSPRVILGIEVDHFNVSFYCTLFVDFPSDAGTSVCGCVLVAPDVGLSAAHCFQRALTAAPSAFPDELFSAAHVRLYGQANPVSAALTRLATGGVFVHPDHSTATMRDDIAVFHLPRTPDSAPRLPPLRLNEFAKDWHSLGPSDRINVVGIGKTDNNLLSLGLPRVSQLSRRSCSTPTGLGAFKGWSADAFLGDICAGPFAACKAGRCADSCQGDSGGPLYRRAEDSDDGTVVLYGVVSRGSECGVVGGYPGIYTPVHKHVAFVENAARSAVPFGAPNAPNGTNGTNETFETFETFFAPEESSARGRLKPWVFF